MSKNSLNRALGAAAALGATAMLAAPAQAQLATGDPVNMFDATTFQSNVPNPTDIAFHPDGRTVITRKNGTIVVRLPGGQLTNTTIPNVDTSHNEKGLLGVVADPDVANNNRFFFYVSLSMINNQAVNVNDRHKVLRGTLGSNNMFTIDYANPVIGQNLRGPANHNGGHLNIYNNQLYVSVGDTGSNSSPPTNKYSSCLDRANGKILRVNLDGSVPNNNPLVGMAQVTACSSPTGAFGTAAPETRIYSWGFRNPYRFWIDPTTGLLWIGDVGEGAREEITTGGIGTHHGYPYYEGNQDWTGQQNFTPGNCNALQPSRPCTVPQYEAMPAVLLNLVGSGGGFMTTPAPPPGQPPWQRDA